MIIDMDYKNEIGHLLQKYFSGTIMPDEQRLLDSWMKEKEEHKQLFEATTTDDYMDQICGCNCITFAYCWGMAVVSSWRRAINTGGSKYENRETGGESCFGGCWWR